jgi:hypothetical protein
MGKRTQCKGYSQRNISCLQWEVFVACCMKRFTTGSRNSLKDVQKSQMMPNQAWKWLRQQSKVFFIGGFDTLVKWWDECISVGGGYIKK